MASPLQEAAVEAVELESFAKGIPDLVYKGKSVHMKQIETLVHLGYDVFVPDRFALKGDAARYEVEVGLVCVAIVMRDPMWNLSVCVGNDDHRGADVLALRSRA